jgi:rhodanese-related sulfurtransferase
MAQNNQRESIKGVVMSANALRLIAALLATLALAACFGTQDLDDAARKSRVASMYADYKAEFPAVPEIAPEAFLARLREDPPPVVIDVREPGERAVSVIPGAITREEFLAHPESYAGRAAFAYCTIGYRSGVFAAAEAAKGAGVTNIAGGLLGYLHAGGTLVDPAGRTARRVHVYGRTWDLAPREYEAVW